MIRINALYVLLFFELLAICAGLVFFLMVRERKRAILHRESNRELKSCHTAQEELRKQLAALKAVEARQTTNNEPADVKAPFTPIEIAKDHDACKREIVILDEKVKEKTKLLIELQEKFDSVEKEYLLLYRQHQTSQEQQKKKS